MFCRTLIRTFCLLAGLSFVPHGGFAEETDLVSIQEATQSIFVKNPYLQAEFSYRQGLRLLHLRGEKPQNYIWPGNPSSNPSVLGYGFELYAHHPAESTETLDLPTQFAAALEILDASTRQVRLHSEGDFPLQINQVLTISSYRSAFLLETTLTNQSSQALKFYPTETGAFNTELGISGMPNMNLQLTAPLVDDATSALVYLHENPQEDQFEILSPQKILLIKNRVRYEQARTTVANSWLALQNGNPGVVVAWERRFQHESIQPVKDNLFVTINGAGEFTRDGQVIRQGFEAEKYIRIEEVLGEVTLKPQQSLTFSTHWSLTTSLTPIVTVHDGIAIHYPLEVLHGGMGFYVVAALGIPQEGLIAVDFYDREGKYLDRATPSLMLDPRMKRPGYAVPTLPSILQHEIWFRLDESPQPGKSQHEYIVEQANKAELYLLNFQGEKIMKLDESSGPWKEFQPQETSPKP